MMGHVLLVLSANPMIYVAFPMSAWQANLGAFVQLPPLFCQLSQRQCQAWHGHKAKADFASLLTPMLHFPWFHCCAADHINH